MPESFFAPGSTPLPYRLDALVCRLATVRMVPRHTAQMRVSKALFVLALPLAKPACATRLQLLAKANFAYVEDDLAVLTFETFGDWRTGAAQLQQNSYAAGAIYHLRRYGVGEQFKVTTTSTEKTPPTDGGLFFKPSPNLWSQNK